MIQYKPTYFEYQHIMQQRIGKFMTRSKLARWANDLAMFKRIVELGALAPAAHDLGIHQSNLSRRLSQLESAMGVRLIEREQGGRQSEPTLEGWKFYGAIRHHLTALGAALEAATVSKPAPTRQRKTDSTLAANREGTPINL